MSGQNRSVAEDYPTLYGYSLPGTICGRPHHTPVGQEFARAVDELVRLRREVLYLRNIEAENFAVNCELQAALDRLAS